MNLIIEDFYTSIIIFYAFLTSGCVLLDGLVNVIGDGGPIWSPERLAASVHKGAAQSADEALKDGLNVTAVAPQSSGKIPERMRPIDLRKSLNQHLRLKSL